jgi:hypothetical protein
VLIMTAPTLDGCRSALRRPGFVKERTPDAAHTPHIENFLYRAKNAMQHA